ncbi:trap transporter solute receptor dctp/teaa [Lucifera butyrica]|uniref:Trap transporter solute receptor dctp/teaa n=1 Tax=Lucifera butyrica TaxID=1351585 RepID=A0A498RBT3_9FIRM|nr:C4-dicarboxylate TRAP transporter substrate-binding protein [Lucifera butyrica]VBB07593.1 trap transporter solute receptor dctp/teaa [Lucifera butyrica]
MKKFFYCLLFLTLAASLLSGCGSEKVTDGKTYTLKIGMVVDEQDPMYLGALEFKKNVEARTNGKVKIEVYPNSQLGSTESLEQQAQKGANVAVITDSGRLAQIVPEIGILGAPYITDNYEQTRKLAMSKLFQAWLYKLQDHGYRVLSFNWYQGDRHFLTNVPVKVPADLTGLRIRTTGSPIWQDTVSALGAKPVNLDWNKVLSGLQQKKIDGAEAQYPATYGANLQKGIKYIAKTGHFQLMTGLVTGEKWFASLPEEYQTILLEEAIKAGDFASKKTIESLSDYEAKLKASGVVITEVDIAPFKKATELVYEKNNLLDLRKQVNDVLGKK